MVNFKKKSASLSTAYFPSVQYFTKILKYDTLYIEAHENYQSQSYRNRTIISGPNGKQSLSLPVQKISGKKIPIKDVKIDYSTPWQKEHLRSIDMAYKSSPFYEYYIDAFIPFFEKEFQFLFDYNMQILITLLSEIEINTKILFTESFEIKNSIDDFRFNIHPKKSKQKIDPDFIPQQYSQVFEQKFNFIENLSIIDLLFNKGQEAELVLENSL